jgi:ferredoxin--NADP+ reductase
MYKILEKQVVAPQIWKIKVDAPHIAKAYKPGNFVIVLPYDRGERIPLTVFDTDQNTISIVFQEIGKTTKYLGKMQAGDEILDIMGPTGHEFPSDLFGSVIVIGGGVGAATAVPLARHLRAVGNDVIAILGARTKELVLFEKELNEVCKKVIVATDDGSYGMKGLVTDALKETMKVRTPDLVLAIGPAVMMKAVADTTKPMNIKTLASLNSLMVCGTGMCGACRIGYGEKTVLTCIEGPELDAHMVDWDTLLTRLRMYRDEEALSKELFEKEAL